MDWNLLACARHHLTYAPDEPELCEHLRVDTVDGAAWRCLRCGDYVPGPPRATGPADEAPVPLRGQLLRDAVVLRTLAVERAVRGLLLFLGAYAVWRFRGAQPTVRAEFDQDLPLLQQLAERLHWNLGDSPLVHLVRTALATRPQTLTWIAAALAGYGLLQLAEGTGLWLLRRWGEYLAAVATALFIPLEVYELIERVTWVRITALLINIGAVVFLVYRKRLFGARGGRPAYDAERHHASLIHIARAATGPTCPP
ncbi:hypothetical protein Cme02nite_58370 [Catellatospora methionotrophica]|uniref:DUF2127 domain-containing protein n=1 Tax=Catellatospora methionotrophica TaxID=121620 RepID=A0A8J3LRE7_9ACTN|nr:DUF2127 domain-containing protein [Catellatospora methionotrophica]GIG17505.1 hypothetical protein Cme02nite_58370 [Catellatospora methionotrophica]